jgi:mRNA-degrading endonuclease RelE of RelBE toxin-antitoxin system
MITVRYAESFLKDLKALKSTPYYKRIKALCFDELPAATAMQQIKNLKKIEGHKDFFRLRLGDYRIGLHIKGNNVEVLRVLHRKEIYKYFP